MRRRAVLIVEYATILGTPPPDPETWEQYLGQGALAVHQGEIDPPVFIEVNVEVTSDD